MWMPAQTTTPPRRERAQRRGDELADRREDDRGVELLRRRLVRRRPPTRAELERERCGRVVSGPDEARTRAALRAARPGRRCAPRRRSRRARAARRRPRGGARGSRSARRRGAAPPAGRRSASGIGRQKRSSATTQLRVAAVEVVAGEAGRVAEVLAAGEAVAARRRPSSRATGRPSAAPVARSRPTIWCPGTSGSFGCGQLAVDDVEVGAADAAGGARAAGPAPAAAPAPEHPRAAAARRPREAPSHALTHRPMRPCRGATGHGQVTPTVRAWTSSRRRSARSSGG